VMKGGYGGFLGVTQPISTPEEARKLVDQQAAKGVDLIKIWVDDERKSIPVKMTPEISKAVIDQAHKHHLRVVAHVFYLADAKELVREGVDGFGHMVRDQPVDNELLTMMKAKGVWMVSATLSREMAYSLAIMPWLQDPFFTRGVTPGTLDALTSFSMWSPRTSSITICGALPSGVCITTTDFKNGETAYGGGEFIEQYVFPHGELQHIGTVLSTMQEGGLEVTLEGGARTFIRRADLARASSPGTTRPRGGGRGSAAR